MLDKNFARAGDNENISKCNSTLKQETFVTSEG